MRALGIIPARGGSRGILRKNIRSVCGQPLIAYTIQAAQASRLLDHYLTSTEDDEIASVAADYGSPVMQRPAELAGDSTPMVQVVQYVLSQLEVSYDYVVLLQPTSPLRTAEDIDAALRLLADTGADSVVSVYQVSDHHPARMYRLERGRLVPYAEEPPGRLRQALPPVYHRNGAIYASRRTVIEAQGILIGPDTRPYIMPRERSLNIDDALDLALAECLLGGRRQTEGGS